jgi:hypothetical protein
MDAQGFRLAIEAPFLEPPDSQNDRIKPTEIADITK